VLADDTDPEGGPLTAGAASDPANCTVVLDADGSFTYLHDPLFTGWSGPSASAPLAGRPAVNPLSGDGGACVPTSALPPGESATPG